MKKPYVYVSEHTKFMREWMAKHPHQEQEQKKGRALWWDRPQELDLQEQFCEARVPTRSYYYATSHSTPPIAGK